MDNIKPEKKAHVIYKTKHHHAWTLGLNMHVCDLSTLRALPTHTLSCQYLGFFFFFFWYAQKKSQKWYLRRWRVSQTQPRTLRPNCGPLHGKLLILTRGPVWGRHGLDNPHALLHSFSSNPPLLHSLKCAWILRHMSKNKLWLIFFPPPWTLKRWSLRWKFIFLETC